MSSAMLLQGVLFEAARRRLSSRPSTKNPAERETEGSREIATMFAPAILIQGVLWDAAWGERLAAAFTTSALSGSLHSELGILVVDSSLVALRSR